MRSALNGVSVKAGDLVQFGITMESKGPEASSIVVLQHNGNGRQGAAGTGQVYSGVIKMYNEQKGWGFLVSPESQRDWGKDIFVQEKSIFAGENAVPRAGDAFDFSVIA